MKITNVESLILQYELDEPLGYSQQFYSRRTCHLVRVTTDESLTGLGEAFGGGGIAFANAAIVEHVLRPLVLGRDPREIAVIWHQAYNLMRDHGQKGMPIQALSALDIALWDILGKSTGLPLYRLLGGPFRTRFKAYGYGMMFRHVRDLVSEFEREAASIAALGFTATKMKVGMGRAKDIELASAVRRGAGDKLKLMADANHAYMAGEAIQVGQGLRDLGFYWFEEPVAPEDYEGYRDVKAALPGLLIAGGEAEFTRWGFRELLGRRCVDLVQPEVCGAGGVSEFQKIATLASTFGIPLIPHVWGCAVTIALNMHLIAALPDAPGGLYQFEPMLEYDTTPNRFREQLLAEPLDVLGQVKMSGGWVTVPDKPGIGVELDEDFVKKYRVK
jgi:D-galactarolactone cycloisomerase